MADPAQYTVYRFGCFALDVGRGELLSANNSPVRLRPKSLALLRLLVEHAGRLLHRTTIIEALWPDIFVTDDSVTQCILDIRRALRSEPQAILRTLRGRGYLFTADVTIEQNQQEPLAASPSDNRERSGGRPRLSLAVLPFTYAAGDPGADHLAEAISDDLSTELSRIPDTFVTARAQAALYAAGTHDTRHVGLKLGVSYVFAVVSGQPRNRQPSMCS